jgi:hypothetical protein
MYCGRWARNIVLVRFLLDILLQLDSLVAELHIKTSEVTEHLSGYLPRQMPPGRANTDARDISGPCTIVRGALPTEHLWFLSSTCDTLEPC